MTNTQYLSINRTTMKYATIKIFTLLAFFLTANAIIAQEDHTDIPIATDYTESNISNPELKEELIKTVKKVMNSFVHNGSFYDFVKFLSFLLVLEFTNNR